MDEHSGPGRPWPSTPEEAARASPREYPNAEIGFVCACGAGARTSIGRLARKFPEEQAIGDVIRRYRCHGCGNPPTQIVMAERIYWNDAERAAATWSPANDA